MAKDFKDLSERDILALAISLEEEDGRIYGEFAEGLRESYPATAKMMDEMQAEESEHRAQAYRSVSVSLWRTYPVYSPPGREGLRFEDAGVAGRTCRTEGGA